MTGHVTRIKQAVLLVGGRGTRLGSLTANVPKPLLEIAPGLRFLDVILNQVARHGFTDIVLLAGHLGDQVEALYQGRSVLSASVRVVREPAPAGTAGGLTFAAHLLDDWFLLSNGDSFFDINLRALTKKGTLSGVQGRLALRTVPDASRYGSIKLDGDRLVSFVEKAAGTSGPEVISGGIYVLSLAILDNIRAPCSLEREIFPLLAHTGALGGTLFDAYFLDIGLPGTFQRAREEVLGRLVRPAAFLDRDGVLNVDIGYTHNLEDLVWVPGAREAVLNLNEAGYLVLVVTNQAGIGRGYYGEAEMAAFHARMQDELAEIGAHIDAFYFCPFHEEAATPAYRIADHLDRKPNPGMILRGIREWPVDAARSFLIGDQDSDVAAARRAGLPGFLFQGGDLRCCVKAALAYLHERS
jgi:D-glycero-D-manno-heptose 1,7-bisphosphate phosphatase